MTKEGQNRSGKCLELYLSIFLSFRHDAHLLVKGATGGIWRFPVRFIATEPEPDDDIVIEATGLGKESSLGFRLTSMERYVFSVLSEQGLSTDVCLFLVKKMPPLAVVRQKKIPSFHGAGPFPG